MTGKQYIILAVIGIAVFVIASGIATLFCYLIFDDDVKEIPYDSEESSYEDAYQEWANKHRYTIACLSD